MNEQRSDYTATPLDWRAKGIPALDAPIDRASVAKAGWSLFDGRMMLPTMVLRRDALVHDIDVMARFAREHGVSLAPHGKTTMSPPIWWAQLDAGAWGITVATPWQARVAAAVGVPRILIANEVADAGGISWLGTALDEVGPELLCQADSVVLVERMAGALGSRRRPLRVLVEVGLLGGRTGVRSVQEGIAVARAIAAAPMLRLAGVTAFEGIAPGDRSAERKAVVRGLMATVRDIGRSIETLASEDGATELLLSGGGSEHFLTVATELTNHGLTTLPVRVLIRSGCTVTHDHGGYDEHSPFGSNAAAGSPRLIPAIEVWAPVLSRPEPGLVIVGAGKRDLPYDAGMPRPLWRRAVDATTTEPLAGATVTRLNDQHAFVAVEPDARLAVGDVVGFGISHPCSAFDRWRFIPVVDAEDRVVDVYETVF